MLLRSKEKSSEDISKPGWANSLPPAHHCRPPWDRVPDFRVFSSRLLESLQLTLFQVRILVLP